MKKPVSILVSVILPIISGCSSLSYLTSRKISEPYDIVNPIFPKKGKLYEEINQKTRIIEKSLKKNFPKGLLIYFKEGSMEKDRYAVFKTGKSKTKSLELIIYRVDEPVDEQLKEYFIREQTKTKIFYSSDAEDILKENYSDKVFFNDSGMDGLKKTDSLDSATIEGKWGQEILKEGKRIKNRNIKEDENGELLKQLNELYLKYLERAVF